MGKSVVTESVATAEIPVEAQLPSGEHAATLHDADEEVVEHQKKRAQLVFDAVAEHLRREPAQATRLLQSWIHTE